MGLGRKPPAGKTRRLNRAPATPKLQNQAYSKGAAAPLTVVVALAVRTRGPAKAILADLLRKAFRVPKVPLMALDSPDG